MAEITVNLIHDLKERHAHKKAKPPFVIGLRTGYLRAWLFVVFKVWLVVALLSGANPMHQIERNITLLDSLATNDFSRPEIFFDTPSLAVTPSMRAIKTNSKVDDSTVEATVPMVAGETTTVVALFEPRGPAKLK